jgi:hypothetical protein
MSESEVSREAEAMGDVTIVAGAATARASAPSPRAIVTHGPQWFAGGFRQAYARFQQTKPTSTVEFFYTLFECLAWAVAAGEDIPNLGRGTADQTILGLRYARNQVHHQWADAVRLDEPSGEMRWKSLSSLPDPPPRHGDPDGKTAYETHVASRPVTETLENVDRLLQAYPDVN